MLKTDPNPVKLTVANKVKVQQSEAELVKEQGFICLCSKSYKSYAAAFTHVKIKHKDSFTFYLQNIKRPLTARRQKGRPKRCPELKMSSHNRRIEILQLGNLDLCEKIPNKKLTLSFHEDYDEAKIQECYGKIVEVYGEPARNILTEVQNKEAENFKQFYIGFCKHMEYEIAAKILWTLNSEISPGPSEQQIMVLESRDKVVEEIWFNIGGMKELLMGVYEEWRRC